MFVDKISYELGATRSVIRELFEYGVTLRGEGRDVYDFSLGNPSVEPPQKVIEAMARISEVKGAHGYTSAPGDINVRTAICRAFNAKYGEYLRPALMYMTAGAAAGLSIVLHALRRENGEVIGLTPYFTEYEVFVGSAGLKYKAVDCDGDMLPDMQKLKDAITENTVAVIVNTPSNPSGVVYGEDTLKQISTILGAKSKEFGHPIYIISDEPYREICFNGTAPLPINYYNDTVICYSYSKSFSLPGERIGYLAVSKNAYGAEELYTAIMGAGRALGYVCAPSLMQYVVGECVNVEPDISAYKRNAELLYDILTKLGFECVKSEGAFYLTVKSPSGSGQEFSERAKRHGVLIVDGAGFGIPEYVRFAYCVDESVILGASNAFKAIAKSYGIFEE